MPNIPSIEIDGTVYSLKDAYARRKIDKKVPLPTINSDEADFGQDGQVLRSKGDGTMEWALYGTPSSQDIQDGIEQYIEDHPDFIIGIPDNSIAQVKLTEDLRKKALKDYATPEMYGAVGNGTTDDTQALQNALNNSSIVILTKKYRITNTITVGTHKSILFLGNAQIKADCGTAKDLFYMYMVNCVSFHAIGGAEPTITGTCNAVFHVKGGSTLDVGNYCKRVSFDNLWVSSETINVTLYMDTLTRQINVHNCTFYTKNAIIAEGKHVEICIDNSLLWATQSDGGCAIKITSALGGSWFNEGWMISDCTIDTNDKTNAWGIWASDFFVFQVTNCYIGSKTKMLAPRSTPHSHHITFSGNVFGHDVILDASGGTDPNGCLFYANINGNDFNQGRLILEQNCYYVMVTGCDFIYCRSGNTDKAGIIIKNGCTRITVDGIFVDETYTSNAIVVTGTTGDYIMVSNVNYNGSAAPVWSDRAIRETNTGSSDVSSVTPSVATVEKNGTIATITFKAAKGSNGLITGRVNFSGDGVAAGGGYVEVTGGDLTIVNASGHGNYFKLTPGQQGMTFTIPYFCNTTGSHTVKIQNSGDTALPIDYHSNLSIVRFQ